MSPEQARGVAADGRSDVFSLGCVLYEMVAGRAPFERETAAETIAAILKEEPAYLTGSGELVPAELERVLLHCLEKNPEQRFQTARDLAFALDALTEGLGRGHRPRTRAAARAGKSRTIDTLAVLPFVNATGDPTPSTCRTASPRRSSTASRAAQAAGDRAHHRLPLQGPPLPPQIVRAGPGRARGADRHARPAGRRSRAAGRPGGRGRRRAALGRAVQPPDRRPLRHAGGAGAADHGQAAPAPHRRGEEDASPSGTPRTCRPTSST